MNCVFCKIISGEIATELVYQDEKTMAFLAAFDPCTTGHTIVISKFHCPTILELPESEMMPLVLTVKKLAGIIQNTLKSDGFTIGINHGVVAGQSVPHLHVHIIPRYTGDGGGNMHSIVHNPPKEPLKEIGEKIRKNIK